MILRRLFTFPPFLGCMAGLILPHIIDLSPAEPFFGKMAATVAPLALFSVGLQLKFKGWSKQRAQLSMALLYKLILAPVLVLIVALLTGVGGHVAKISVFEASMPTFITASVVAEQFHLNFRLINLIIGIGILLGLVTSGVWSVVVERLF